MPTLTLDSAPPVAVKRVPTLPGAKLFWTLKAEFGGAQGVAWLRYSENENDAFFDVVNASGRLLQRARLDPSVGEKPPLTLEAHYLDTARRNPLLYLRTKDWHHVYAFPDGFAGFMSENSAPGEGPLKIEHDRRGVALLRVGKERRLWSGASFSTEPGPDVLDGPKPLTLPLSDAPGERRVAGAFYDRFYFLLWVTYAKEKAVLSIFDKQGKRIARHRLKDDFGASPRRTSLYALWLDNQKKRGPILVVRDGDTVQVHVFGPGLSSLVAVQQFNDFSTSLSATTTSFGRDKNGILTVKESFAEMDGGSSETNYRWTGRGFAVKK